MKLQLLAVVVISLQYAIDLASAAACSGAHQVQINAGCFQGSLNASTGIESFLGVPFAKPPIGPLRFKAPVPIEPPLSGVQDATKFGDACMQVIPAAFSVTPGTIFANNNAPISENCLVMNVYRAASIPKAIKLPIVIFIPGGGNRFGAGSTYDPTLFINRSVDLKKPLMFITFNYRVTTFGWLASSKMPEEDLNAGFLDQRQLLRFVQQNAAHFGGDPERVTLMGQSYGGGAVELHMIFPDPALEKLPFRASIINSASGPYKNFATVPEFESDIGDFTLLLKLTGCPNDDNALDCLRAIPADSLLNTTLVLATQVAGDVWPTALGGPTSAFTERPSLRITRGDFRHIPTIGGTMTDDGTLFVLKNRGLNATSVEQADALFRSFIVNVQMNNRTWTPDVLDAFNEIYPQNTTDTVPGAPFASGDALYDRTAQWWSEMVFISHRRAFVGNNSLHAPTWAYLFTQTLPIEATEQFLGAFHGTELSFMFGQVPDPDFQDFIHGYIDKYINFVTDLDPGAEWPRFNAADPQILQFAKDNITTIPDDFRKNVTDFLLSTKVQAEMEK